MRIADFFSSFKISASGLSAQKKQLNITAENIANSSTTRTIDGTAYKRKVLLKKSISNSPIFSGFLNKARIGLRTSNPNHISASTDKSSRPSSIKDFNITTEVSEKSQFKKLYDPNHPDADEEGYVEYPDINVITEMLDLITASRAYDANVTVMNAAKSMARRTLSMFG